MEKKLLSRRAVATRFGISYRTQLRREKNETLDFPKALYIGGKAYFAEGDLDAFDRRCAEAPHSPALVGAARARPGDANRPPAERITQTAIAKGN
jgi:hypothetical protein